MAGRKNGRRRALVTGFVVVGIFGVAVLFGATAHEGLPWSTQAIVRAAFDDVGSLRIGDDVRVGGVRVGRVSDIAYREGRAVAELELSGIDTVYRNAEARSAAVGARSALGAKFVNLDPGTPEAGEIGPDEIIRAEKTSGAQDITGLFDALDAPTRKALGSLLREIGGGFAGRQADIDAALEAMPEELPNLGRVSGALAADGGADTVAALRAMDQLAGRFEGRSTQLARLNRQLGTTLDAVATDGGVPLAEALNRAPATLHRLRGSLRALEAPLADTESAMTALRPGSRALADGLPDVRGLLREAPRPLEKIPGVAEQATPAVRDLTPAVTDARPLAPQLTRAFDSAADPLAVLAPYSPEVAEAFTNLRRALDGHDGNRHWLRVLFVPSSETLSGIVPGYRDPLVGRNPYPAPGEAATDRKTSPLGGN